MQISRLSLAAKAGLSASGAGVERSHVGYLLFAYLLVEEVFNEEAPEVDEGNTVAAAFQFSQFLGIVLQALRGHGPHLTAADPSPGMLRGALQSHMGPSWVLVQCGDAPGHGEN